MNRKWKGKGLISLAVIFTMLFSAVLTAAATEPDGPDVRSTVMEDTETETVSENSLGNSNDEPPADTEDPGSISPEDAASDVHEHSWSADWGCDESFHWHECEARDCPVTVSSEKNGHGEHNYGDDGVCTECGYFKPANRPARTVSGAVPTYQEAYQAMIALKDKYPEGMTWTNFTPYGSQGNLGDSYVWNGGKVYGANRGVGCAAFAFILSDAAFGSLPARVIERGSFTFADVKVGDILRVNGGSHSVIVLQKSAGGVIVAEGNHNKSVHWGRAISETEVLTASYVITRYPKAYVPSDESEADKVVESGTEGNLSWSLTKAGTLTISGSGAIPDYSAAQLPPWSKPDVSTVVIENGVTGIGDYAFYQSSALSIYIPDGITRIGRNAFYGSQLISVTIPGTVEVIGDNAFHDCKNLTSATVSEGVKTIENEAFWGCTSLAYIDFPASITSVGSGAFMSCEKMIRVRFMPGGEKVALGDNLFSQCWNLTSVTLPQMADCISSGMFASCISLPVLYIPASVTKIGAEPFTGCDTLKRIYFGGTEAEWKAMMNPYLEGSLMSTGTTVTFNAVFDNPFAQDPDDPGDFWPDEDGKDPTGPDDGAPAHKHSWSETWNSDGAGHWHECGVGCSITDNREKAGYGAHSYDGWVIDINATASQDGSRHRDCGVCGYRQTEPIPAAGSSDGSNNNAGGSGNHGGGSNNNTGGSNNSGGGSNNNAGGAGDNGGDSNDHVDGSGEPDSTSRNDLSGDSDVRYGDLQQQEPLASGIRLNGSGTYPAGGSGSAGTGRMVVAARSERADPVSDALSERDGNERSSDDENESAAETESLLQDQEESEPASEELSGNDKSELPQMSDGETEPEDVSGSGKDRTGMIISTLSVLGGGALGGAFVFRKRKFNWKK